MAQYAVSKALIQNGLAPNAFILTDNLPTFWDIAAVA